jgi:hypothetical protein
MKKAEVENLVQLSLSTRLPRRLRPYFNETLLHVVPQSCLEYLLLLPRSAQLAAPARVQARGGERERRKEGEKESEDKDKNITKYRGIDTVDRYRARETDREAEGKKDREREERETDRDRGV